jgi:iron complex outermembrane receptor protein
MKRIAMLSCLLFAAFASFAQNKTADSITARDSFYWLSPVEVRAIRASENAPFTKTNISKNQLEVLNLGQDIPFLLDQTPSVVINADAGNGIGYTGIRIRGTDATRINVTLNGIPYNDAESQGTFFVDLPDFSSSVNSIQVQRGVGASSNGAGAFGGSINFSTNELNKQSYAEINNSYGSFNSWKNTIKAGTGLMANHFTADLRVSHISSDGFIDRAASQLRSLHFSTAYSGNRSSLRFNVFLGKEKTYQAWYGISEADLRAGNRTINYAGTEKPGSPYDNETDNYWQNHYQLFYNIAIAKKINFNTALFYTKGKGYYEQYKADQAYSDYNLPPSTIGMITYFNTDLTRQLWLDNKFYGSIFSLQYKDNKTQATLGGGYNKYDGDHFGKLIWAEHGYTGNPVWYIHTALKNDFNIYLKEQTQFKPNWSYYYDLQYRHVNYTINGFEDNPSLTVKNNYNFFNPKLGITYSKNNYKAYFSYSVANKEPNRDDFEANQNEQPRPEKLQDLEAGIEKNKKSYSWSATLYYMKYKDQLVLTGKINNVGAYTRTNIPRSYRAGIELQGMAKFNSWLQATGNITLSKNKVLNFTEYIDDYDNGGQKTNNYSATDIALSPAIVGAATISFFPVQKLEISFPGKFVDKQYLDNTQQEGRKLNAYYEQNARLVYTVKCKALKKIDFIGQVNNLFNKKYEPNGYTYNYFYGGVLSVNNYYFPMAKTNFMVAVNVSL